MSAEQPSHHPERTEHHAEHKKSELEAAAHERLEHLQRHAENAPEADSADRRAEAAREIIKRHEVVPEPEDASETETPAQPGHRFNLTPRLNYAQTLESIQRRLTPASQTFSKVIHTPAIEKASEAIENTIARPSVTAGATWTALIVGSIFYFTARRYGYALSGSEIELSFIVGAAIGLGVEWCWRAFVRRPRHK